jgi:hypothetical protein
MTKDEIRQRFWQEHPQFDRSVTVSYGYWRMYPTDVRDAFCSFVDRLRADGEVDADTASTVTLLDN